MGYGDYYPVTLPGRIIAVVMMVIGISLFGLLAGTLANVLANPKVNDSPQQEDSQIIAEIEKLRQEIQELSRKVK